MPIYLMFLLMLFPLEMQAKRVIATEEVSVYLNIPKLHDIESSTEMVLFSTPSEDTMNTQYADLSSPILLRVWSNHPWKLLIAAESPHFVSDSNYKKPSTHMLWKLGDQSHFKPMNHQKDVIRTSKAASNAEELVFYPRLTLDWQQDLQGDYDLDFSLYMEEL